MANIALLRAPIISALADSEPGRVALHTVSSYDAADSGSLLGFHKPTDILLSRWYPGYRVTSLRGKDAEETIAILLSMSLSSPGALENFRLMLSSPRIPVQIIAELFPRASVPIKSRKSMFSEGYVREVVARSVELTRPGSPTTLVDAYAHAFIQVLSHPNLDSVLIGEEQRIIGMASSMVIGVTELRQALLIDALRGVFADARIAETMRSLSNEPTPQVFAEVISRMFRSISHVIPEIQLRLDQLDTALALVRQYIRKPAELSPTLRAHSPLASLASISNFVMMAVRSMPFGPASPATDGAFLASVSEQKDACTAVLSTIQTAPSIEFASLASFAEYFGQVPITTSDGTRRGTVIYGSGGQASKMDILDVRQMPGGRIELAQLSPDYAKLTVLASAMTNSLGSVESITQLANIVANEVSREVWAASGPTSDPVVVVFNSSADELDYLAMHRAEVVAVVGSGEGPRALAYACSPATQWRSGVAAATPDVAFFTDPIALLLYTSSGELIEPRQLPARAQSIGATVGHDVTYLGEVEALFDRDIQRPFNFKIPVSRGADESVVLDLNIGMISHLLGFNSKRGMKDREDAYYASVAEPGVDDEYKFMFAVALAYASGADLGLRDLSRSWLVERLAVLVLHPAVQESAARALNEAVYDAKVDLRHLASSYKDTVIRAGFGTALAALARFNKLNPAQVKPLIDAVPLNGLSIKAQLALVSLPVTAKLGID